MGRKIKILVVIRHPVGGIRTYLKYTYSHLDSSKYKFSVLTVKDPEGSLIKSDLAGFELGITEVKGRFLFLRLVWKTFNTLQRGNFDLIHSQGVTAGVIAAIGNLISRTPHILTSHDVFREDQFASVTAALKKWLLAKLLSQADFIQSVSYDARENLVYFLSALKRRYCNLVVIHNGVLVNQSCQQPDRNMTKSFREEIGISQNMFLFGFLGRFMPQKGFDLLIDAVSLLSNELDFKDRFRIAAVNDGAFIREYKKIISDKRLSGYFIFHGFTSRVGRVLMELDALIIPSRWEAYGLIAAEALVFGCPVIASDCIGLREVVKDTPAVLIRKDDSKELAEALRQFMRQPANFRTRTAHFIPEAQRRFSSERTAVQLESLFQMAIKKRGY